MTKGQAVVYSLIFALSIAIGVFIAFNVWWTQSILRFLGLVAFILISFGSIFLSISLTRLLIPSSIEFGFSSLRDKYNYQQLKETIGHTKMRIINSIYLSLFVILFSGIAYGLITSVITYEQTQLSQYGQIQKVKIKDIRYKAKSRYTSFDFYFNGQTYTHDLGYRGHAVGDTVIIIFSTHHPDIVQWAENFKKKEK